MPATRSVGVGQRQLLDAVPVQQRERFVRRDPGLAGDEALERRHVVGDAVAAVPAAHVARRQDAGQAAVAVHDQQARDAQALDLGARLREARAGLDGVRVGDDRASGSA